MNMKIGLEVMEQVTFYFKENLPKYTVLKSERNPTIPTIPISTWYRRKRTMGLMRSGQAGTRS